MKEQYNFTLGIVLLLIKKINFMLWIHQKHFIIYKIVLNVDPGKHRRPCTCWHMSWGYLCVIIKNLNISSYHEKHQPKSMSTLILSHFSVFLHTHKYISRDSIRGRRWTTLRKINREIITQNMAIKHDELGDRGK